MQLKLQLAVGAVRMLQKTLHNLTVLIKAMHNCNSMCLHVLGHQAANQMLQKMLCLLMHETSNKQCWACTREAHEISQGGGVWLNGRLATLASHLIAVKFGMLLESAGHKSLTQLLGGHEAVLSMLFFCARYDCCDC